MLTFLDPRKLRCAELFFHVFAHVEGTSGLPASVHSPRYVAWAQKLLGDPAGRFGRTLAEDARLLAEQFPSHEALASVQPLARLFDSVEHLREVETRPLAELTAAEVDAPWALEQLQALGPGAELAFCALLLELPFFSSLPAPPAVPEALSTRLASLVAVAPGLAGARVGCVRSLYLRGRAWGDEIWVGHPAAEVAPSIEHAAWQAAHEATVVEVTHELDDVSDHDVEGEAVVRLTHRAASLGEGPSHAAWLEALVLRD